MAGRPEREGDAQSSECEPSAPSTRRAECARVRGCRRPVLGSGSGLRGADCPVGSPAPRRRTLRGEGKRVVKTSSSSDRAKGAGRKAGPWVGAASESGAKDRGGRQAAWPGAGTARRSRTEHVLLRRAGAVPGFGVSRRVQPGLASISRALAGSRRRGRSGVETQPPGASGGWKGRTGRSGLKRRREGRGDPKPRRGSGRRKPRRQGDEGGRCPRGRQRGARGVGDARLLAASGVLGAALAQPRGREWKGRSVRPATSPHRGREGTPRARHALRSGVSLERPTPCQPLLVFTASASTTGPK